MKENQNSIKKSIRKQINLLGTIVATYALVMFDNQDRAQHWDSLLRIQGVLIVGLPMVIFHLAGCGFLLLFENTVHPWRQLGKEREGRCWGKLRGTKKGIVAEPTVWDQVSTNQSS